MRIAFVTPWYGDEMCGGAENLTKSMAESLARKGVDTEVITTCVKRFQDDWSRDHYAEGLFTHNGVKVRRFKVRQRDDAAFDGINGKLMASGSITKEEEAVFMREMINSPAMYEYLEKYSAGYDKLVFIPYMFGTTYHGVLACPEKAVLVPCLHDESYAYLSLYRDVFSKVKGIVFNSRPEYLLARDIYPIDNKRTCIIGAGVDAGTEACAEAFREKYGIIGPFIAYAGKRSAGKNTPLLVELFKRYKRSHPGNLKLVLMGSGDIDVFEDDDIIDLGFLPEKDKMDAFAAASISCNPSVNESFSIVLMESWLCGTPVLAHGGCDVTREHCMASGGGLYFRDYPEFEACLDMILSDEGLRKRMGENGRKYVLGHFTKEKVADSYIRFLKVKG